MNDYWLISSVANMVAIKSVVGYYSYFGTYIDGSNLACKLVYKGK